MRISTKELEILNGMEDTAIGGKTGHVKFIRRLSADLLEARELIKEMRAKLLIGAMQANNDMTMFRSIPVDATVIADLIKRTKEYAE